MLFTLNSYTSFFYPLFCWSITKPFFPANSQLWWKLKTVTNDFVNCQSRSMGSTLRSPSSRDQSTRSIGDTSWALNIGFIIYGEKVVTVSVNLVKALSFGEKANHHRWWREERKLLVKDEDLRRLRPRFDAKVPHIF